MGRRALVFGGAASATAIVVALAFSCASLDNLAGGDAAADAPDAPEASDAAAPCCVPAAPAGWSGPFAFYAGNPGNAPDCPLGTTEALAAKADLVVPPAKCGACSCGPPTGTVCRAALALEQGPTCDGGSIPCYDDDPSGCTGGALCGTPQAVLVTPYVVDGGGGACVATEAAPVLPPLTWRLLARGCQGVAPSSSCAEGQVCPATLGAPFKKNPCIVATGNVACPGDPYSVKSVFFSSATDARTCSGCRCGQGKSVCGGKVSSFSGAGCAGAASSVATTFPACIPLPGGSASSLNIQLTSDGGCPATPSQPDGGATPSGPTTVCCML